MNKNLPIYLSAVLLVVAAAGGFYYYNYQQQQAVMLAEQQEEQVSDDFSSSDSSTALDLTPPADEGTVLGSDTAPAPTDSAMVGPAAPAGTVTDPGTATAATVQVENREGCMRKFDEAKLATDKVDIAKYKFATLDVKGFGKIKIELFPKDAPKTVENFMRLINAGYYDCLTFHRIAKGFVIQGGDPVGNGSGGISAFGPTFEDELNPETESYKTGYVKGVLAMANRGPNTNGSQFFIMIGDNPQLPHNYTIFGKVSGKMDAVDKIAALDITPGQFGANDGTPKKLVQITKAVISTK
ncbi:MAG TPA: peptidylprolyl isomerase [Patescibacteria group bacterium]|nr:peptidylprolyl isomerase [Patescibacteria group bacterium]